LSQRLHKLIKTLTPNEKGHLKKTVLANSNSKENSHRKLFDIFDQMDNYDGEIIKAQVLKRKLNFNLNQAKIYLEGLVLKELANIITINPTHKKIDEGIQKARILLYRGMPEEANKIFNKLEIIAQQSAHFSGLQNLYINQYHALEHFRSKDLLDTSMKEVLQKMKKYSALNIEHAECLEFRRRHEASWMLSENFTDIKRKESLSNLANEMLEKRKVIQHPSNEIILCQTLCQVLNDLGRYEENKTMLHEFIELYEQNPELKTLHQGGYVLALFQLTRAMDFRKEFATIQNIEQKARDLTTTYSYNNDMRNELLFRIFRGKAGTGLLNKDEIKEGLTFHKKIGQEAEMRYDANTMLGRQTSLLITHFIIGEFEEGLDCIQKAFDAVNQKIRFDLKADLTIMKILCHYHLESYALLPYLIKQAYRYLRSIDHLNPYYTWLLKSLKKINSTPLNGFNRDSIKPYYEEYLLLESRESAISKAFDLSLWFEAVMQNKTCHQVLLSKLKAEKQI